MRKQMMGKPIDPAQKALLERVSLAINTAASGEESAIEDEAARRGASLLFDQQEDGFISALAIALIPREYKAGSRRIAAVAQPFGFVANIGGERVAVITPLGYVTDFASIPRIGQFMINPFGRHAEAAVIHDWLYTLGKRGDWLGRRRADKTFIAALKLLGVNWVKRQVMFWAVRLGGWRGYGKPEDFTFRRLDDLKTIDPTPPREPYDQTYARLDAPAAIRAKAAQAATAVKAAG